jgi:hypothetical protein
VTRESCGTPAGLLAHQSAGEKPCGTCALEDAVRRIAAEGVPSRPTAAGWLAPVARAQAAANAAVLLAEVEEFDRSHRGGGRRPLRVVRGGKSRHSRSAAA